MFPLKIRSLFPSVSVIYLLNDTVLQFSPELGGFASVHRCVHPLWLSASLWVVLLVLPGITHAFVDQFCRSWQGPPMCGGCLALGWSRTASAWDEWPLLHGPLVSFLC